MEQAWFPEPERCSGAEGIRALQALGAWIWPGGSAGEVKLFVIKEGDPNAFAVPGRRIVVFSGLIDRARSPEMLAGVLAHEMGHVELHHPMRGLIHQLGLGAALTLIFGDSSLAGVGHLALALSYNRDMEREADQRGIELLQEAGVRADGMSAFRSDVEKGVFSGEPASGDSWASPPSKRATAPASPCCSCSSSWQEHCWDCGNWPEGRASDGPVASVARVPTRSGPQSRRNQSGPAGVMAEGCLSAAALQHIGMELCFWNA